MLERATCGTPSWKLNLPPTRDANDVYGEVPLVALACRNRTRPIVFGSARALPETGAMLWVLARRSGTHATALQECTMVSVSDDRTIPHRCAVRHSGPLGTILVALSTMRVRCTNAQFFFPVLLFAAGESTRELMRFADFEHRGQMAQRLHGLQRTAQQLDTSVNLTWNASRDARQTPILSHRHVHARIAHTPGGYHALPTMGRPVIWGLKGER